MINKRDSESKYRAGFRSHCASDGTSPASPAGARGSPPDAEYAHRGHSTRTAYTMKGYHDIGGDPAGEIPRHEHEMLLWEKRVEAMLLLLSQKGLLRIDENRRGLEAVGAEIYHGAGYAQRRILSISTNLIAKGLVSIEEVAARVADIEQRKDVLP